MAWFPSVMLGLDVVIKVKIFALGICLYAQILDIFV